MEEATKDDRKIEQTPQDDKQTLESSKFLEASPPISEGNQNAGRNRVEGGGGREERTDDDTEEPGRKAPIKRDAPDKSVAVGSAEYEKQVLLEVARLLDTPLLPEDEEMSRLAPKTKAPNKSISRPSLSHVNSKIPGELTGQPSVKSTKEDVKYWKNREQELLDRIAALESRAASMETGKDKSNAPVDAKQDNAEDLPSDEAPRKEKDNCKSKLQQIERELFAKQKEEAKESSAKSTRSPEEIINHLKAQNEDLRGALAKMTAILRDKTALCVNQEKKVAALANQVESLKEVVAITKDLLNIRNMEVQHISNDIQAMETKIDCERQRHNQMLIKMDEAVKLNSELKKEYENQMKLFQQLRDSYEEKIRLISQNGYSDEGKEQGSEQQRSLVGSGKSTQIAPGKTSRSSNFKVNFQDT